MKSTSIQLAGLLAHEQAIQQETEILRDANIALTENLSLETVFETLLDFLTKLIPCDSANVMLLNEESRFVVSALKNYEGFQDVESTRAISFGADTNGILQRICKTKHTVVVPDTRKDADWEFREGANHVRNWMGVPLVSADRVIGLYSVDKTEPDFFRPEHVRLAETLAARAVSAIRNAQLFEQTQRYVVELEERIAERRQAEIALRESEERYRELFENARDAIYVHDLEGNYTSINRAAEQLSGYTREEIIGHKFTEFIADNIGHVGSRFCTDLAQRGETTYEVEVLAKDGRRVPVEVSSRAIYENGVLVGIQGMARDITERKLAQDALQMFSRKLIQAQEDERRRIARELHDQIGQILTAVKMNLYTVQKVCPSLEAGSYVKDNIEAVDEALRLVRDLSVDLRPPVLDDLGLVTALRWYVDRYTSRSGLNVKVAIEMIDDNERFSRDIETACFRIAQEALTNVVRHAKASHVVVQLAKDENNLVLSVTDNGAGFDLEQLRKQSSRTATLGLVGMQERAHAADGVIEIDSEVANGTVVRLRLPLDRSTQVNLR